MASSIDNMKKVYNNIDDILDYVLDTNNDSDINIDLDGSDEDSDDYDSEWEGKPDIQNPMSVIPGCRRRSS